MKNNGVKIKLILLVSIVIMLLISNAIVLKLYLDTFKVNEAKTISNTGDELSRVKYFIKDWFDEISRDYQNLQTYQNELRFNNGAYTLTVYADRIRAVYPKGTRYFQMEYVTYIEFKNADGDLRCTMHYNDSGELSFKLK